MPIFTVPKVAAACCLVMFAGHAGFIEQVRAEEAAPPTAPKDAGGRYGQALGVLEVCYGSKLTGKGKALEQSFTGPDLETFKAAAAKVYDAWVKVRACTNQRDPNTCKIIMDKSCLTAESEIGAMGTEMPGLVEFIAHP